MSIWIWGGNKTRWGQDWLLHLPSGLTITVDISNLSRPAVVIKQGQQTTYLYEARNEQDAKEYLAELGKHLLAVDIKKSQTQRADTALALEIAKKHFPDAKEIVSDDYFDCQSGESYPIVYIRLPEYDENFLARLRAAKKEVLGTIQGRVVLTTDYR